ncbi:MAG: patatin-like phospholipase family protein [Thermoplasmatales archaeon]|nr:MAG: patatin-like phospholipase family protein [Thermoplasmatales archaeon]
MGIKNLVYAGSGSLLPAYAGATEELFKNIDSTAIERICGTSGGSIYGYLLILHSMDAKKVTKYLIDLNFKDFFDNSFGVFRDTWRLIRKGGWNKGEKILKVLSKITLEKTGKKDINFSQLNDFFGIDFTVVVTDAERSKAIYCSYKSTPDLSVIEAVRRSMSIPLVFVPRSDKEGTYVDGGVCNNFAIDVFDRFGEPSETLGFKLIEQGKQDERVSVKGLAGMIKAVRRCWLRPQFSYDSSGLSRTIFIPDGKKSGMDPLDNTEKRLLINNGKIATEEFFR